MDQVIETKFIIGDYKKAVTLKFVGSRIWVVFAYNKKLIEEIKQMEGARYHGFEDPPIKQWSIKNSSRNRFQIAYLEGKNPYAAYDAPIVDFTTTRKLYDHQRKMVQSALTYRGVILACEMGTGKTLAAIEVLEHLQRTIGLTSKEVLYVGPKSGVFAVGRELVKWNSLVRPVMITYEGLTKMMKEYDAAIDVPPRVLILDESSKIKNPTSQRSAAAFELSERMRESHKENCYIIEMSGTPAPKTPADWWHLCEVACPGFLKEGSIHKFKARLCVIEERLSITGGVYPHIVTWLDDASKCRVCGLLQSANVHDKWFRATELATFRADSAAIVEHLKTDFTPEELEARKKQDEEEARKLAQELAASKKYHEFAPSKNEIDYLYQRMKGLVLVQFKKDCLDLPEKQYRIIEITPPADMIRAMKIIKAKSTRAIEALTLIRELADGFQYVETASGETECGLCHGKGKIEAPIAKEPIDTFGPTNNISKDDFVIGEVICDNCGGVGKVKTYVRTTDTVASPKDEVFIDLLDEHEDIGRFIVWGGFTGTIDRLLKICHKYGWATLRVDGRGYTGSSATGETIDSNELLDAMDYSNPRYKELLEKYPKLCFVGHPQAGGMALTLTASPTELFYSNCFNGEARMQAEDRFHRAGMDANRGATIIDLILLPTDRLVLDNLKKKKKLQSITMGELETALEGVNDDPARIKG
jgi:SNF2 family DNA or RNA helicase